MFTRLSASFGRVLTAADAASSALEHSFRAVDNVARMADGYTEGLVTEQKVLREMRLKDMAAKMEAKYQLEKSSWTSLKRES